MKKHFIFTLTAVSFLFLSACVSDSKDTDSWQNIPNNNLQNNNQAQDMWSENFNKKTIDDLATGNIIAVMGEEDSNGSFSATRIILGDDFDNFLMSNRTNFDTDEKTERPFKNNIFTADNQMIRGNNNSTLRQSNILKGEILKIEDNILTLKLIENSGSKLIFFSEKTEILEPQTN